MPEWLFRLAAVFALAGSTALLAEERIEGVALRLPARTEAYREHHAIGPHSHTIEYRAPDGSLIADKQLDYRESDSAPAFLQRDLRRGTRIGARWEDGRYLLQRNDEERGVDTSGLLVASSGFDRFVRSRWDTLALGEPVDFDFALPARLQTVGLRIAARPARAGEDAALHWFRIAPTHPLLRAIVDPIELAYDDARRLRVYSGVSNLVDADGGSLDVEISYRYADEALAAAALPEPDQAPASASPSPSLRK